MIAQNDGTAPVITYFPDEVLRIGPASEPVMDLTNKASVVGLGYVEERNEVETNGGDGEPHLEVIVGHNDWDSHVCQIRLAKLDEDVKAVSLANGHQNPRTVSKASPSGSTPGKNGRTFYKFGTKPITPVTPGASVRNNIEVESPLKGKGKARDPDDSPVTEESIEAQVDIESVTEGPSKKGRGRPRLDESEGASKKQKDK
ncbi:hypothetical protein KEM48_000857 [Puccinia striiformis f. sp. tritici PST-130]|nr:hypothetical protein KEM48_000857 [Puccinia striiformis f. sp. tritici PST-130]